MIHDLRVTVVMPAFNEALQITRALQSLPPSVDAILVVDDASEDGTAALAESQKDTRIEVLRHATNRGVGAAIATGYMAFLSKEPQGRDVCIVMAGDGQMDPEDLPVLVAPLKRRTADYAKGDRLHSQATRAAMPWSRFLGNHILTLMTRFATGYWSLRDSQCGYTAITADALRRLPLQSIYPRYGYPNDLLFKLRQSRIAIAQVPVKALYGSEKSGIRPHVVVPRIGRLLLMGFLARVFLSPHGVDQPFARIAYGLGILLLLGALLLPWLPSLLDSYPHLPALVRWLNPSMAVLCGAIAMICGMALERVWGRNSREVWLACDSSR